MTFTVALRTGNKVTIAIASAAPCAGAICLFGKSKLGVGTVQGWPNPCLHSKFLNLFESKFLIQNSDFEDFLLQDPGCDRRQIFFVPFQGKSFYHHGNLLNDTAAYKSADNFIVAGNTLKNSNGIEAAYNFLLEQHFNEESLEKIAVQALQIISNLGSDKRGESSAAILSYLDLEYPTVNIRIDFSDKPIEHLLEQVTKYIESLAPIIQKFPKFFGDVDRH